MTYGKGIQDYLILYITDAPSMQKNIASWDKIFDEIY